MGMAYMIQTSELRFRYSGQKCEALSGLGLNVGTGEITLVSGPTGCGKSTLGLALCGAIPHLIPGRLSGNLLVCGRDPRSQPIRETVKDLGFLLQNVEFMTFTDRVEEEIAFGLENFGVCATHMKALIGKALNRLRIAHLQTRPLSMLSAGERQRVLLAAMLALNQPVLVLDEPLAFLDHHAQKKLLDILSELSRSGRTVMVFEHRRDMVRSVASKEFYMRSGNRAAAPESTPEFHPLENGVPGETLLVFEDVSFSWPKNHHPLISSLSFELRAGESMALLGTNGTGKTSLLYLAMGLLKSNEGIIRTCGMDPVCTKPSHIAQKASFIFQQPDHQLYLATVKDEVCVHSWDKKSIQEELETLNLMDLSERHPRSLSMGQKRRVTIAAALARKPRLLLLDEPSVGQDDQSLTLILARLSQYIQEGGALLATTHDKRVAKALARRTITLGN